MTDQPHVVQLLCDLIALPSVNTEGRGESTGPQSGESRVADYVQRYFEPFGLRIERQEVYPGRENVLVHVPGADPAAKPVLLEAHMDTVDVEGMDRPFTPRIEGGRIYGRGTCDTKGSLAAEMAALREVLAAGIKLSRGCVLAATVDEESTMGGIRHLVQSGIARLRSMEDTPSRLLYHEVLAIGWYDFSVDARWGGRRVHHAVSLNPEWLSAWAGSTRGKPYESVIDAIRGVTHYTPPVLPTPIPEEPSG